jgi:AraC-like DNA-binding protein
MNKNKRVIIEYRVYNLPLDVPAIILAGEDWRISDEISSRLHFHNCLEIGFCHSDEGELVFEGGEKQAFRAGDATIIPPYVPHTTYSRKGTRSLWSYIFIDLNEILSPIFSGQDFLTEKNASIALKYCLFNAGNSPRLYQNALDLFDELRDKKSNWEQAVKALSFLLNNELIHRHEEKCVPGKGRETEAFILKPALEYIRDNYKNHITIKDLSDICFISENHFRRLFLSIMGTSPLNYINETRIKHACALLENSDMPVLNVSNAVGINSFSNFNRYFKSLIGLSPREYRKMPSKGNLNLKPKYVLTYQGWLNPEEHPEHVLDEAEASNR